MADRPPHPKYSSFRFDAGSLALNFVATVRHRGSQPRDLLPTTAALAEWFGMAGLQGRGAGPSNRDHRDALLLREAVYRTLHALIGNETPAADDILLINTAAAHAPAVPQIEIRSLAVRWESAHPARSCLAEIARDAVMVIGSPEPKRLKMCSNHGCRMLFVDNSPANRRRWCAMSICGNREKIRAHRQKKRSPGIAGADTRQQ